MNIFAKLRNSENPNEIIELNPNYKFLSIRQCPRIDGSLIDRSVVKRTSPQVGKPCKSGFVVEVEEPVEEFYIFKNLFSRHYKKIDHLSWNKHQIRLFKNRVFRRNLQRM